MLNTYLEVVKEEVMEDPTLIFEMSEDEVEVIEELGYKNIIVKPLRKRYLLGSHFDIDLNDVVIMIKNKGETIAEIDLAQKELILLVDNVDEKVFLSNTLLDDLKNKEYRAILIEGNTEKIKDIA